MITITGIDIRKALLESGLRPSDYDEQGIYNYIHGHAELNEPGDRPFSNDDFPPETIARIAVEYYKVR